MHRALFLYIVVSQCSSILQLLAREYEALLVRGDALLVLDLAFHHLDCVSPLHLQGNGLTRQCFYEDLHVFVLLKYETKRIRTALQRFLHNELVLSAFAVPVVMNS